MDRAEALAGGTDNSPEATSSGHSGCARCLRGQALARRSDRRRQGLKAVCNLYSLNKNKNTVATMFRVPHNRTVHIDPLPGIFPNYTAPVVRHAADGEREMALMSWGFPLAASRQSAAAGHQCARRQDPDQLILATLIRATPLPGASHLILRAQR